MWCAAKSKSWFKRSILVIAAIAGQAHAFNFHEHVYSFPTYDSIVETLNTSRLSGVPRRLEDFRAEEILGYLPNYGLNSLLGDEAYLRFLTGEKIAKSLAETKAEGSPALLELNRALLQKAGKPLTFGEFVRRLIPYLCEPYGPPCDAEQMMRAFFQFDPLLPSTKRSYVAIEQFRRSFFEGLKKRSGDIFSKIWRNAAALTMKGLSPGQSHISLTVGRELVGLDLSIPLTSNEVLLSVPRNRLNESAEDFEIRLKQINSMFKSKSISGVDIVGSIFEEDQDIRPKYMAAYKERLKQVIRTVKANDGFFQIHAYEGKSDGNFYKILREALSEIPPAEIPKQVRIAHINHIQGDLKFFEELQSKWGRKSLLVFEANVSSNFHLQGSQPSKIAENIERLQKLGFPVLLGTDGTGILGPNSTFSSAVATLRSSGLSPEGAARLVQDSRNGPNGWGINRYSRVSALSQLGEAAALERMPNEIENLVRDKVVELPTTKPALPADYCGAIYRRVLDFYLRSKKR